MKSLTKILLMLAFLSFASTAEGQIKIDLKKKLEQQVNRRLNQKTDQAIDKTLDSVEKGVVDGVKNGNNTDQPAESQNDQETKGAEAKAGNNSSTQQTALESYSKYDFVPGEKVIFFDDFSQDAVGDFPALWNTNGSAEVVTTNLYPGNWMRFVMWECVWTDPLLNLPENYTIEFDVVPIKGTENGMGGYITRLMQAKNAKAWDGGSAPGGGGFCFNVESSGRQTYSTWLNKTDCQELKLSGYKNDQMFFQKENQKYHIAIWVQKSRIRLYQDQNKLIDLPKAFPTDCLKPDRLRFEYGAMMISNVRIAVGAPDMRNKLMTEGKLVTYGIYFDVNKDVIKPESYGTLKEIASILNEVPDVKVKIVGHTDSDGADASNLDLSKRRAASVKSELVKSFGVNGDRLETDGMGETQPVAPNDTQVNKALNRRVEFIKL